jgi:hypothetical protein
MAMSDVAMPVPHALSHFDHSPHLKVQCVGHGCVLQSFFSVVDGHAFPPYVYM